MMSSTTTLSYAPRSYAPITATTTVHASSTASAPAATTAAATAAAAAAEKHLLAERYKTKMCRNYLAQGSCPYETRCMFAHGDHELRTAEMNLRDGLVTEEAVKAFQRLLNQRTRAGVPVAAPLPQPPVMPTAASSVAAADDADETASVSASACSCPSCGYNTTAFAAVPAVAPVPAAVAPPLEASVRKVFVSGGSAYRHEPYAPVVFCASSAATPHRIASPDNFAPRSMTPSPRTPLYATCECEDCIATASRIALAH